MSTVLRWVFTDPYDTNPATNTYTFPQNPAAMTSVFPERAITPLTTTAGKILLQEGATPAKSWQFSGPILSKEHLLALQTWTYTKANRITLVDHFGRTLTLVMQTLDASPSRRLNYYWSHDYTATALILSITAPTVGDTGPAQ